MRVNNFSSVKKYTQFHAVRTCPGAAANVRVDFKGLLDKFIITWSELVSGFRIPKIIKNRFFMIELLKNKQGAVFIESQCITERPRTWITASLA